MISIKRGIATIAVVQPDDNVVQQKEISGVNMVELIFTLPHCVKFKIQDWATILGETYYVTTSPTRRKEGNRNFSYSLIMEGEQYKLGRVQFMQANPISQYFNNPFFINDRPIVMMTLLLRNIERIFPGEGWKLGNVIDGEVKNLSFDSMNCLEALNYIAEQYQTEWLIDGRTIHLFQKSNAVNYIMKQGENEAFYSLEEKPLDNSNIVNRLYVYGSQTNLPANYRNGRTRLTVGSIPYIEGDTSNGVWEDEVIFDDIKPTNDGVVTGINANPLQFIDTAIPFNVNDHLMDGVTAKVSFETGQLAGYEFDINNYNHSTKTFTINKNTKESAIDIPSAVLRPAVGDKYFVFDIRMPDALVLLGEQKLRYKGVEYMGQRNNEENNLTYTGVCNPLYFKRKGLVLKLADSVIIQDEDLEVNAQKRVVKLSRNVRNPYLYTCEFANRVKENKLVKILSALG